MKGLILTHLDRREEGLEFVKKGIRLDLTSHICWHVFGLIQKGQKNYEEALKSYTQALRFDKVCIFVSYAQRLIGVQPRVASCPARSRMTRCSTSTPCPACIAHDAFVTMS